MSRLYFASDTHNQTKWVTVARAMAARGEPDAIIDGGDLTNHGALADIQGWQQKGAAILNLVPCLPCIGDAEAQQPDVWCGYFDVSRYYSRYFGNITVYVLDPYSDHGPTSTQYQWLLAGLELDRAAGAWSIVAQHLPVFTSAGGSGDTTLVPLFETYKPLVLGGHNHLYCHNLVNGVHYFVSGCGGGVLASNWQVPIPNTDQDHRSVHSFVEIREDGDTLRVCGVTTGGTEFDVTTITRTAQQEPALLTALKAGVPQDIYDAMMATFEAKR